jgi:hypothetical protein
MQLISTKIRVGATSLLMALLGAACMGAAVDGSPPAPEIPVPGGSALPPGSTGQPDPAVPGQPPAATEPGAAPAGTPAFRPGPAALRRLTRVQYQHAIEDLLGRGLTLPPGLDLDSVLSGFASIGASLTTLSETVTEKLETAAMAVATQALAPDRRARLVGCLPAAAWDEACASKFITGFGRRAWRRPLAPDEVAQYLGLARQGAEMLGDFWQGLGYALSGLLQSPHFLYRVELGTLDPNTGWRALDDWELATRLSFLVAGTTPDAALLNAAEARALTAPGGLRREAERLLDSPRGRTAVRDFLHDLLRLDALDDLEQAPADFPLVTPTLGPSMREEALRFVERILQGEGGDYRRVFDTRTTFVNRELARLYGLPPPAGTGFVEVTLPSGPRLGLLGQAAFLAPNAHEQTTSPTRRGKFVREVLLCHQIPEPPAEVDTSLPPDRQGSPPRTMREKLAGHNAPACAACHVKMDPVGLAFENFDALGVFRDTEAGRPIDASGDLDGQAFAGPVELAGVLRGHADVEQCLVRGLWRYGLGRVETEGEEGLIARLSASQTMETGGANRFRTLLLGLIESEGFRVAGDDPQTQEQTQEDAQ